MKKIKLIAVLLVTVLFCQSQESKKTFPFGTYHTNNKNINGISFGIGTVRAEPRNVNTNGIKIELIGAGIILPLIPKSPVAENGTEFETHKHDSISEHINGLVLSASGTVCDCITNGAVVGIIGHYNYKVDGFSGALFLNLAQINNGVQLAAFNQSYLMNGLQFGFGNYVEKSKGVQIGAINNGTEIKGLQVGVLNKSEHLRGFQIGIWNMNQKRKLPFINWAFS